MRRFGPFELAARLGRGGSAEVWRAVHRGAHGFDRTVALKRLLPERLTDERFRTSLLDEARLAAQLTHANIAQVLEVVEADGEHAIVMELVDGCDLRTLVRAMAPLGPPPPGLGAFVAHEACRALGAAHLHHPPILHRDVSATNVLVARTGAVKLADFGIGKALETASTDGTASGVVRGNLGYMSPEQLAREPVSPATDVYAAGVLLWEMLTGRRLFAGTFDLGASAEARRRPILPPSAVSAAVPPALDAVCARAMALVPGERWSDGAAMARALEPHMHALGFGPTQLAGLMRDFAPPPVEDEPARHTVTAAGAKAVAAAKSAAAATDAATTDAATTGATTTDAATTGATTTDAALRHTAPRHTAPRHTAPRHAAPRHTAPMPDAPRGPAALESITTASTTHFDARPAEKPRRARFVIAALLGAAAGLGAFFAWPNGVTELAPPPRSPQPTIPLAVPLPSAEPPPSSAPSAPPPASSPLMRQAERKHDAHHGKPAAVSASPTPPAPKATPDFVDGKLLNPFRR